MSELFINIYPPMSIDDQSHPEVIIFTSWLEAIS